MIMVWWSVSSCAELEYYVMCFTGFGGLRNVGGFLVDVITPGWEFYYPGFDISNSFVNPTRAARTQGSGGDT